VASAANNLPYWLDEPAKRYRGLAGDEGVDVAIIGGGITGLSCARAVAHAGARVRVLEARRVGSGASGRNGGFAVRGMAARYDRVRLPELMRLTEDALPRLASLAGDAFRPVGSLRVATSDDELAAVRAEHDALCADGFAVEWVERDELPPLLRPHVLGGMFNPRDGALEQGRWVRRLAALTEEAGALIAEETRATGIDGTRVLTPLGHVDANAVVVATDGYTRGLIPEVDALVVPARGQVVATAPLRERHFDCPVSARWGYDYFQQLPDLRVVAGGRRDIGRGSEDTTEETTTAPIQAAVEEMLREVFGGVPDITHRWAGLMAFTPDLLPLVGSLPGRGSVWLSLGYSGHGNVLAFACGELVAAAILDGRGERLGPLSPGRFPAARRRA
jgi:gamma-glutamylputrescine oxidase